MEVNINMETVIIKDGDTLHRVFGEVEQFVVKDCTHKFKDRYKYKIKLTYPLDSINTNKIYNMELMHEKVIFRGYLTSDGRTIIED